MGVKGEQYTCNVNFSGCKAIQKIHIPYAAEVGNTL